VQLNSIVAARYQILKHLGAAAFSRAVQGLDIHTNEMVCMKIIKNEKDFVDQSLDEIKLLKLISANADSVDDKHCLRLIDSFYHKEHLIIITELLRENLYEVSKWSRVNGDMPYFTLGRLQRITKQLLVAVEYIHRLYLIHSDIKPENILLKSFSRCQVKLIDFGSSCFIDDHLSSYVQSRSYRAPEVLLGLPYGQKVDIWSLGCVIAELWTGYVLFQNDSVQSLLVRILGIIGEFPSSMLAAGRFVPQYFTQDGRLYKELEVTPELIASAPAPDMVRRIHLLLPKRSSLKQRMKIDDEDFLSFLSMMLKIDPSERLSASEALQHPWLNPGKYSDGL
jgi:serine/threonine protein kinase